MGNHLNTKRDPSKHHKRGYAESQDIATQRQRRVSFKHYIQELEESLLEQEFEEIDDPLEDDEEV